MHQAVSAGAVIMLAQTYGPWALCGYALVAVVGWSRVELRDHPLAQVIAGTILGSAVAAAVFAALR
ncbi:phosphatase PAP2 family protein [Streptomyces sp. NPDC017248]|uniref:phosphatase PAP2 family protein n=1 Tax=unclassified Streptomyces TaxID=2593676 RepID=UPI0037A9FE1B